jgi:hypothetical protein
MTRPRPCAGCGLNPVAYYGREFCYDCVPRTWKKPPRCKLCGSAEDYYTNGRCRRCHRSAHLVGSCLDCMAWGVTRHFGWLCEACLGWRRRFSEPRECASCSRLITVNARGYCRLCTRQASLVRLPHCRIDVAEACRNGHQLYFAGMFRQKRPEPERRPQRSLPWPGQYPVPYRQLVLFDGGRDLAAGRRAGFPSPPLPGLAAALEDVLADHAARHGWGRQLQAVTRSALRVLLATQDTPGAPIRATDVEALTQLAFNNVRPVTEILTAAGMLEEDRESALDAWFTRRASGLPEPMATEFNSWFETLRDGSRTPPRIRPRSTATIRVHVSRAVPILHAWASEGRQSLRRPGQPAPAGTVRAAVAVPVPQGPPPHLRRPCRAAAARPAAYRPAAAAEPGHRAGGNPQRPARTGSARRAGRLPRPAQRPARWPRAHRRPRRAAPPGRAGHPACRSRPRAAGRLARRARPPLARHRQPAPVHQLVHRVRESPVSSPWITHTVGVSPQAVREDRILHEALATGGDVRRLCDLFDLTVGGAERYARAINEPAMSAFRPAGDAG